MNILKVGQINFYCNPTYGDTGENRIRYIISKLNEISNEYIYEYHNCLTDECDIVFYSLYNSLSNLNNIKGNPVLIYWTDELLSCGADIVWDNPYEYYKADNYSISFYDDSSDNLFLPFFVLYIDEYFESRNIEINKTKDNFCTFCASNDIHYNSIFRKNVVKYISDNYKTVTCCGKVLNNTNNNYLPYNLTDKVLYHQSYKFNLCFENNESSSNTTYLTEKIMNAYTYNTVPIYWGCERVNEWFNKESFINCNGLTEEQILKKIKEVDNDNDLYEHMKNAYPFKYNFDYVKYFIIKLQKFIEKII